MRCCVPVLKFPPARKDGPRHSLPLHRAVLDAVIAQQSGAGREGDLVLIDGAHDDIEQVLASRRRLPKLNKPASWLLAQPDTYTSKEKPCKN